MSPTPFYDASGVIQLHVIAALVAQCIGPFALYGPKGAGAAGRWHRWVGYTWVLMMALTALSSFWINGLAGEDGFSAIHLLSVVTLCTLVLSYAWARQGRIEAHQRAMRSLYWYGLVLAGAFNFLPGRLINNALLGEAGQIGIYLIALVLLGLVVRAVWGRRRHVGGAGEPRYSTSSPKTLSN